MIILNIIICILILSILVLFHELGHYIVAKRFNVRVEEFGIGYPPKIISFKKGETVYSLNWIPFGGFNKLTTDFTYKDAKAINTQKPWKRILILLAGSVSTGILAYVIVFLALIIPHDVIVDGQISVQAIEENSPAYNSCLEIGDIILNANGIDVSYTKPLVDAISNKLDQNCEFTIQKENGEIINIIMVPRSNPPEGQGALGITAQITNYEYEKYSVPFYEAISQSIATTNELYVEFITGLGQLFTGEQEIELTGPIGMVQLTGTFAEYGFSTLMMFMALLAINLTILNLLPIPGLDGGQILIAIIEWVNRKPIPVEKQNTITLIGFMALIAIMFFSTYQDISRLISGVGILP